MCQDVALQLLLRNKSLLAIGTSVRLYARVLGYVSFELGRRCKGFGARGTGMRFFSCVDVIVPLQVARHSKRFITRRVRTCIWFFSGMRPNVSL